MTKDEALKLALEALEEHQYGVAQIIIREALAQPQQEQESVAMADYMALMKKYVALKAAQPEQGPVAWMTEERYAEMHTSKWTPKIQQVFSKDGILESQTIQYAPQSKTVPYPPAQRTWVGLSDEEVMDIAFNFDVPSLVVRTAEAKLKELNT